MPQPRRRRIVEKIEHANTFTAQRTVLLAPDKFRGTASARELALAMREVVEARGLVGDVQPLSDGGEGFVDAFVGTRVMVEVPGVRGTLVSAPVVLVATASGLLGVIEVASVIGRDLLPHPSAHEAIVASSEGVGHLIRAAAALGAASIMVGCGGSATSDAGLGCYLMLRELGGLPVPVTVAADVAATFSGARRFAEQKGVGPGDLIRIDERLVGARQRYQNEQGLDVELVPGSGASGGVAGALIALGARVMDGFGAVVNEVDLASRMERASLVITGEGRLDAGSLEGKVVLGVAAMAPAGTEVLVICGSVDPDAAAIVHDRFPRVTIGSLEDRFGHADAVRHTRACVMRLVDEHLEVLFG